MGTSSILIMFGAVVVGLIWWLAHHVRRETPRRRQVARIRAAVDPIRVRFTTDAAAARTDSGDPPGIV